MAKEKGFKKNSVQTAIGFGSELGAFSIFRRNALFSLVLWVSNPENAVEEWYKDFTIAGKVDIKGIDAFGDEWLMDIKTISHVVLTGGRRLQTLNVLISSPDERGTEYLNYPGEANCLCWYSPGRMVILKHEDLKAFILTKYKYSPLATYRRGDSNTVGVFYRNHKDETWIRVPIQELINAGVPMMDLLIESGKVRWDLSTGYDPMRIPSHG